MTELEEEIWNKWYVRYASSAFMLILAYMCFMFWNSGIRFGGLGIFLFNPVVGVITTIIAIVSAWEFSLFCLVLGLGYLLLMGIIMLPTSVAITLGAIIIAYVVKYHKNN